MPGAAEPKETAGTDGGRADRTAGPPWITSVYNQKGGVGKTTTAASLATTLAAAGSRVLVIDLDAQGNATTSLGLPYNQSAGAYDFIMGDRALAELAQPSPYGGLHVLAASRTLAGLDLELAEGEKPQFVLRQRLANSAPAYDHIIIDCPPALGMLPVNALVASHSVLVPAQCETFSHDGLVNAFFSLKRIRSTFNPGLVIHGVLITMMTNDPGSRKLERVIRDEFAEAVIQATIPRDPAAAESAEADQPLVVYRPDGPAAQAYQQATREFLFREQDLRSRRAKAGDGAAGGPEGGLLMPGPAPLPVQDPEGAMLSAAAHLTDWHHKAWGSADITSRRKDAGAPASSAPPSSRPATAASAKPAKPAPRPGATADNAPADDLPADWTDALDTLEPDRDTDGRLRMVSWILGLATVIILAALVFLSLDTM